MGPLVWVLNLWSMRLAAGAAVLATMSGALAAMYLQAQDTSGQLTELVEQQKAEQAAMWEGL